MTTQRVLTSKIKTRRAYQVLEIFLDLKDSYPLTHKKENGGKKTRLITLPSGLLLTSFGLVVFWECGQEEEEDVVEGEKDVRRRTSTGRRMSVGRKTSAGRRERGRQGEDEGRQRQEEWQGEGRERGEVRQLERTSAGRRNSVQRTSAVRRWETTSEKDVASAGKTPAGRCQQREGHQ